MGGNLKGLIKNYIDNLDIKALKEFGIKNNINLSDNELNFVYNMIKENVMDILKDEKPYLEILKKNINNNDYLKIEDLVSFYKNKYKGYLF